MQGALPPGPPAGTCEASDRVRGAQPDSIYRNFWELKGFQIKLETFFVFLSFRDLD